MDYSYSVHLFKSKCVSSLKLKSGAVFRSRCSCLCVMQCLVIRFGLGLVGGCLLGMSLCVVLPLLGILFGWLAVASVEEPQAAQGFG